MSMKPSYEELEEQLNRSRRLCDAALANERVWETTMMEACGEDGPASVAAEIAALRAQRDTALESLRQQLAAVVAENTHARKRHMFIRALAVSILEHSGGRMDWRGAMEDAKDLINTVDEVYAVTPATDAAIANIQAQGVEMFAHSMAHHLLVMEKNGEDAITKIQVGTASRLALAFAAQLRQGSEL